MVNSIRFGISRLPEHGITDADFLDDLVERGHSALELPFVDGFPWKEKRCREFGEMAASRGLRLSVHAPYFAGLTLPDDERAKQSVGALDHTMKLGAWLGAEVIVAHLGGNYDESPETLMGRIRARMDRMAEKFQATGVGLGLETAGNKKAFGSLGDIAQLAAEYEFVRPVVDWAHLHAMTGGSLTTKEAFASVLGFVRASFPGWMISPLHSQFSDNEFGATGEIKHVAYGHGSLRVGPLVEAAHEIDFTLAIISEARDMMSHDLIWEDVRRHFPRQEVTSDFLASGVIDFPNPVLVIKDGRSAVPLGADRALKLSNLGKVFFPDDGYTKGDLIQYYASISPYLLPHLKGRPLSMSRYPDGITGQTFYEKRAPGHQPAWMRTVPVPSDSRGETIDYLLADNREALMWFANMGCVEVHPFHSRSHSLECPDYAIFDFDPADGSTWDQVIAAARLLQVALIQLGLEGYPKLSGSRGLHVYVPLDPIHDFARVRRFVGEVGSYLASANPDDITMEWEKPKRRGRVFIDHNRNAFGQTVAAAYSIRPLPGAPVSVPLSWDEVGTYSNGDFTVSDVWDRLESLGDLFAPVGRGGQTLDEAENALDLPTI